MPRIARGRQGGRCAGTAGHGGHRDRTVRRSIVVTYRAPDEEAAREREREQAADAADVARFAQQVRGGATGGLSRGVSGSSRAFSGCLLFGAFALVGSFAGCVGGNVLGELIVPAAQPPRFASVEGTTDWRGLEVLSYALEGAVLGLVLGAVAFLIARWRWRARG